MGTCPSKPGNASSPAEPKVNIPLKVNIKKNAGPKENIRPNPIIVQEIKSTENDKLTELFRLSDIRLQKGKCYIKGTPTIKENTSNSKTRYFTNKPLSSLIYLGKYIDSKVEGSYMHQTQTFSFEYGNAYLSDEGSNDYVTEVDCKPTAEPSAPILPNASTPSEDPSQAGGKRRRRTMKRKSRRRQPKPKRKH